MAPGAKWLLVFLQLTAALLMDTTTATNGTQPAYCNKKCGGVEIPYPFGVGAGCYAEEYGNHAFNVSCDYAAVPPRPFFGNKVYILNISPGGQLRIEGRSVANDCYDREGNLSSGNNIRIHISNSGFRRFSHTRNKFVVLGCDSIGLIYGTEGVTYTGGCISSCQSRQSVGEMSGNCSGVGCCQTAIPRGLSTFNANLSSFNNHRGCWDFNPCGYAFLVEESNFTFDASAIGPRSEYYMNYRPPVVQDWSFGTQTCQQVLQLQTSKDPPVLPYACRSDHSECFESEGGVGYNCKCKDGFRGNPYLLGGCQDVDECQLNTTICQISGGSCNNTEGGYNCICPPGTSAKDPKKERCLPPTMSPTSSPGSDGAKRWKRESGIGVGVLTFVVVVFCLCWVSQRRKLTEQRREMEELKEQLFKQNGGPFLQELISSSGQVPANRFRIFTEEELAAATNGFGNDQIIGRGGHGIVYKGRLPEEDGMEVAVKKSRAVDKRDSKEFAREIAILSQIHHVNVVRLEGCCLEVEIPMLVYEYVPCGTLYDFIHHQAGTGTAGHGGNRRPSPSLATRMRLATETAEALAYLHSYASHPILHGDVKTANILLDEHHRVKVSDFGASTVAPIDDAQLATVVQGTCGYLDPEYLQTFRLTTKSDVYSFGVVLAELLTGKKPLELLAGPQEERCLAVSFVSSVREEKLMMQMLDAQVVEDGEPEMLWEVALLACQCLNMTRDDRPHMKDVVTALQVLRRPPELPWCSIADQRATEESESLLPKEGVGSWPSESPHYSGDVTPYLSMQIDMAVGEDS